MNSNNPQAYFKTATLPFYQEVMPEAVEAVMIKDACMPVITNALIRLLVTAIAPAQIYRSAVKNNLPDRTGYMDIMLVMPQQCKNQFTELAPVLELVALNDQRICCSLHQEQSVVSGLLNGHVFYSRFFTRENLIYNDGSILLPEPDAAMRSQMNKQIRKQFSVFLKKASCFYESAIAYAEKSIMPIIVFMLHQAVELTYRGILENLNGYAKKTHDLRTLRKQTRRCAPQLGDVFPDDSPEEQRLTSLLNNAYSASRYDSSYTINVADLTLLMERTKKFLDTAGLVFEQMLTGE